MDTPYYEFLTRWEIDAPIEALYDLLSNPSKYACWMKNIRIRVTPISPGNNDGIGREDFCEVRAVLPYTLRWKLKCVQARRPFEFTSQATGDLEGVGKWIFQRDGNRTVVVFQWNVFAKKFLLRISSWLLKPLFQWNHNWVMAQWEKDLRAEVAAREKRSKLLVPD